jgi:hypothetical protein
LFKGHLPIPLYKKRTQLASVEENKIYRKVDTNGDDNLEEKLHKTLQQVHPNPVKILYLLKIPPKKTIISCKNQNKKGRRL